MANKKSRINTTLVKGSVVFADRISGHQYATMLYYCQRKPLEAMVLRAVHFDDKPFIHHYEVFCVYRTQFGDFRGTGYQYYSNDFASLKRAKIAMMKRAASFCPDKPLKDSGTINRPLPFIQKIATVTPDKLEGIKPLIKAVSQNEGFGISRIAQEARSAPIVDNASWLTKAWRSVVKFFY